MVSKGWLLCPAAAAASAGRPGKLCRAMGARPCRCWRSRVVEGAASACCAWGTCAGLWSFTIQQLDEEELGAAAVEHMAPEPIGAAPRAGAGVGRGAAPRIAGVEVPGHELGAAVVHLGTLGDIANVKANDIAVQFAHNLRDLIDLDVEELLPLMIRLTRR